MSAAAFEKTAPAAELPRFSAEVRNLTALGAAGVVRVPAVIDCGLREGRACLVLEHLQLLPLDRDSGAALGRGLAALHRHEGPRYGWDEDNFIGASPQENGWRDHWAGFFAERRLAPQLLRAGTKGMTSEWVERGLRLKEKLAAFFVAGQPRPSLLHGDLWHGNAGRLPDGSPVIFDPACYYGDRETDLAMAELFGGFPVSFYAAYREAWPLAEGFEQRKTLYNLYHVLNHFNLFGAAYLGQAQRMMDRLLAELG